MNKYWIKELDEENLRLLYSDFGIRCKEIGQILGISEGAVLKRLKNYGIPTILHTKKRESVEVYFVGKRKDKRHELTDDVLLELCKKGKSDSEIGELYGMTGEGVAYRRKKIGVSVSDKFNKKEKDIEVLHNTAKDVLEKGYYNLTCLEFSKKYSLTRAVWLPYLRSIGIKQKEINRINQYPSLTSQQRRLIIAGLLGDGCISSGRYSEFHSKKQEKYLRRKGALLKPYLSKIQKDGSGFNLKTITHPIFREFHNHFYKEGIKGKLIPIDLIKSEWGDDILAFWFFDDGTFDDEKGVFSFSNFCPEENDLIDLIDFLNQRYGWGFTYTKATGIYIIHFLKKYYTEFADILLRFITPDLYYKIPEEFLNEIMVSSISIEAIDEIRPKFYRLLKDQKEKIKIEKLLFNYYRKKGFPYAKYTEDRLIYLLNMFKNSVIGMDNNIINHNTSGLNICDYFFPNLYDCCRKGYQVPTRLWEDDMYLMNLIRNRLKHANRVNLNTLRTGIKLAKMSVSNFRPTIAKYIYKEFGKGGRILDYSAGFGSRMLSAMSLGFEYVAFEPAKDTFNNLVRFGEFLKKNSKGTYDVICKGSEEYVYKENYFDIAFSSPPYFDYEKYSNDEGQSIIKYSNYEEWLKKFWKKVIYNSFKSLKNDGLFGVCISPLIAGDLINKTFEYCLDIGFYLYKDFKVNFKHVFSKGNKSELVFLFSKNKFKLSKSHFWNGSYRAQYDGNTVQNKGEFPITKIRKRRILYSEEQIEQAKKLVCKESVSRGKARGSYQDIGLLGVPTYVLERHFGSWNKFIKVAGLTPEREIHSSKEHVENYLTFCLEKDRALSFHEYGKETEEKKKGRLKRLFNTGKKYYHLKEDLFKIALKPELWEVFLKNFH